MAFDDYADNHSVPPKSCRPQEVRENLPQSFHSLVVSEPDPITLFTPYILSVFCLSNAHAIKSYPIPKNSRVVNFPRKITRNKKFLPFQVVTRQEKTAEKAVRIQCSRDTVRTILLHNPLFI